MQAVADIRLDPSGRNVIEGFARVVALDGATAWLEPEQGTSCGTCMSSSACASKNGYGFFLKARRFPLANEAGLRVGERVVVGVTEKSLVRASLLAYLLPMVAMLAAAVTVHAQGGSDGMAMLAALGGLAGGMVVAGLRARILSARGDLKPHFLRRAYNEGLGIECH